MKQMLLVLFILVFGLAVAVACGIPTFKADQGSTLILYILPGDNYINAFDSDFLADKDGMVVLGVDISQPPGHYTISLVSCGDDKVCTQTVYAYLVVNKIFTPIAPNPHQTIKRQEEIMRIRQAFDGPWIQEASTGSKFGNPLDYMNVQDEFGQPRPYHYHGGVDLRTCDVDNRGRLTASCAKNVHAVSDGVVVYAAETFAEGKMVIARHSNGIFSLYMHLAQIKVEVGNVVNHGQTIGISGSTGNATIWAHYRHHRWRAIHRPHVHFELRVVSVNPDGTVKIAIVDPLMLMEQLNAQF